MDITKRVDVLKSIADAHRKQFSERRVFEWRIVGAVLSFYVLAVGAIATGKFKLPAGGHIIALAGFLILALGTAGYLARIHMANNMNKGIAENAEDALLILLNNPAALISKEDILKVDRQWVSWSTFTKGGSVWGWVWQSATLILVAFAAFYLISLTPRA